MLRIGEGSTIEVVDDSAGSLVTTLAGAVDICNRLAKVSIEGIHSIDEAFGCPGVGLNVNILVSTGCLESVIVDGHAVCRHNNRILVAGAVSSEAGGYAGGVDLSEVFFIPQVCKVYHVAFCTPVGNETLRTFHNQIRSILAFNGHVDLVVTVGVVKVLNRNFDAGSSFKVSHQGSDSVSIAPLANRVRPESDLFCGLSTCHCAEGEDHAKRENDCEEFLHVCFLLFYNFTKF